MSLPSPRHTASSLYIGLMSGTSLDGVDGVLASFGDDNGKLTIRTEATAYLAFDAGLRGELMALQQPCENEIEREARAGNRLTHYYAQCVEHLLRQAGQPATAVCAIGAHGQTIRHRPELGFTWQTGNPALLAELTGIDIVADFRSRDIAAGGQGAPLVPAFHRAALADAREHRVIVNIGGIANISLVPPRRTDSGESGTSSFASGFDTGPGNVLMDEWVARHLGQPFDDDGRWAQGGHCLPDLLDDFLREPYFSLPPPKSTGRDLFHATWLDRHLARYPGVAAQDVQATLASLTATTVARAIAAYAKEAAAIFVCGGGARNGRLMELLKHNLTASGCAATLASTDVLGMAPSHVEPLAFAWLARQFMQGKPGNLHEATGAKGPRRLGAWYPAC